MECPRCGRELTAADIASLRCPHCSAELRIAAGVLKTSTVRVAVGESDRTYRSIAQVPPEVQEQLKQALEGPDSETLLIADEAGRDKINQVIKRFPPQARKKVLAALKGFHVAEARPRTRSWRVFRVAAALAGLMVVAAWLIWIWQR